MLGSTGSKYVVTLAAERHSCQCMDFRIRQRECKHIRLVLQQLGVAKHPQDWHQVCGLRCHQMLLPHPLS